MKICSSCLLSTSLAWLARAGCSRAETFSQLSSNKFTPLCSGIREYECMIRVGRNMCCCNHVDIVGPRVHDIHIVFDTVSMSVINLTRSVCLLSYHLYVCYPIITFTSPSPLVLARVPPVFHRHLICRINTGRSH